jgi:para-nitrobenzyl esterase
MARGYRAQTMTVGSAAQHRRGVSKISKSPPLLTAVSAVAALLVGACGATEPTRGGVADPAVVTTGDGVLRGAVAADHRTFFAIPYAAAPVGDLRWRAPQPPAAWAGERDATAASPTCPQMGAAGPDQPLRPSGEEDCLYLNVDTPLAAGERPRPVIVFLHGGGFTGGAGAPYDPTRIVTAGDVVFVSVNYRLGALGFLRHPSFDDPSAGNFGLADQQAALRWVRENIAAFGGDPANVTLWGESAGAFSTCAHLAAPDSAGLFHKAIVQSGPCGNALLTPTVSEQRATATAAAVGCADPAAAATCLRERPVEDFVGLGEDQINVAHRDIAGLPWLPVAETAVLPVQPLVALQRGSAADVPLVLGGTKDEMRTFVAQTYDAREKPVTAQEYPSIVGELYGPGVAERVLAGYPSADFPTPSLALATLLTDEGRMLGACTQLRAAEAAAGGASVFLFEFAQPSTMSIGSFPLGAHHGADIPFYFDSRFPGAPPRTWTEPQRSFADTVTGYWTAFAHSGRPGPDWPLYRDGTAYSIAVEGSGPVGVGREHRCDFWRSVQ